MESKCDQLDSFIIDPVIHKSTFSSASTQAEMLC